MDYSWLIWIVTAYLVIALICAGAGALISDGAGETGYSMRVIGQGLLWPVWLFKILVR